jgi:hypothetical protein
MVIEVRPGQGGLLPATPEGLPSEMTAGSDARSSLEMNAFDLLDLLEKRPEDVLEMVRANIWTTYMNEFERRERAQTFGRTGPN